MARKQYNTNVYNWNTPIRHPDHSEEFQIWKLNQLINFGLHGEMLNFSLVRKYWRKLSLDSKRKKFLRFLLWPTQS